MIDLIMRFGPEHIFIRVDGNNVQFASQSSGNQMAPIDGLKLDRHGTEREFPDLVGDEQWRMKAIERFKEKMKKFKTEEKIIEYLINDLKTYGYTPLFKQKAGFRKQKLQDG